MTKKSIEDLSSEKLNKRKIFGSILLLILIVAAVLDAAMVIYDIILGNGINIPLIAPAIACIVIAVPIFMGLKKINQDLKRRNAK